MSRNSFFNSSNPVMKEDSFQKQTAGIEYNGEAMTMSGAVNKTLFLFSLLLFTTALSYFMATPFLLVTGAILGFIAVLVGVFKPHLSPYAAPAYALFEGLFVGSISALYAAAYEGIVLQAVGLTFGTLLMMLLIYKSGLVKITHKFRMGVLMATGAVALFYIFSLIAGAFGMNVPLLHSGGMLGVGVSVLILVIASLNLLLDFDLFERGEREGAPEYMEWFAGMSLLVTLVWLYVEFLRLLSILQRD